MDKFQNCDSYIKDLSRGVVYNSYPATNHSDVPIYTVLR
jgi:hypothetical protein